LDTFDSRRLSVHGRIGQALPFVGGVTTIFHYDKDGKLIAESTPLGVVGIEYLYLGDIPVGGFK
jgi:hypothetical protein